MAPLDKGSWHGVAVTEGINREQSAQLTEGIKRKTIPSVFAFGKTTSPS